MEENKFWLIFWGMCGICICFIGSLTFAYHLKKADKIIEISKNIKDPMAIRIALDDAQMDEVYSYMIKEHGENLQDNCKK